MVFEIQVRDGDSECECRVGRAVLCGSPVVTEALVPAFESGVGDFEEILQVEKRQTLIGRGIWGRRLPLTDGPAFELGSGFADDFF